MNLFNNLKTRTKIYCGFGVVLAMAAAMGLVEFGGLRTTGDAFGSFRTASTEDHDVGNIASDFLIARLAVEAYLASQTDETLKTAETRIDEADARIEEYNSSATDPQSAVLAEELDKAIEGYRTIFAKAVELTEAKRKAYSSTLQTAASKIESNIKFTIERNSALKNNESVVKLYRSLATQYVAQVAIWKYIATGEAGFLKAAETATKNLGSDIKALHDATSDPADQAAIKKILTQCDTLTAVVSEVGAISTQQHDLVVGSLNTIGAEVWDKIASRRAVIKTNQAALSLLADQKLASSQAWAQISGGIAFVFSLAAAYFLAQTIVRPILRMTSSLTRLADGDHTVTIRDTGRKDEVGQMASALSILRDRLAEADRMRSDASQTEARQMEQLRVERNQIADHFEATMGLIAGHFAKSSQELADAARNLSLSSEESSRQVQIVAGAAEDASENVRTVAAETEDLSKSIRDIDEQVSRSASIAGQAAEEARSTNDNISALSTAAREIEEVVDLINNIASQTNLLALNATIEAARAGEAGRGFAVVASEVKQLAGQTARATDEISRKIAEIQSATNMTVDSITHIVTTISTIREVTTGIAEAVAAQGAATVKIAENTRRATDGADEVSRTITSVGSATAMTGTASTQLMGLSASLSEQSASLQLEVSRFVEGLRAA